MSIRLSFIVVATFCIALVAGQLPPCPDTYGLAVYPHEKFCDQFYKCENGTLTLETCENGLLFDTGKGAIHNFCNYNWAVKCGDRLADVTPISSPGCAYQFGLYEKGPGCYPTYIKCAFGVPYETPCKFGLAYDPLSHSCNWPDLLVKSLSCDPEALVGYKCPEKVEPGTLAYKFWPYPRFSIGQCDRLITCVNGYPRVTYCEAGKFVDELSLTCDYIENHPKCGHK